MSSSPTYSTLISAADYNRMMSKEHLYIAEADRSICSLVCAHTRQLKRSGELLEIGCGPLRLTPLLCEIPNVRVTALDHDPGWQRFAEEHIRRDALPITFVCADIATYHHPTPLDVIVSQGTHHHLQKGTETLNALRNLREHLSPEGILIVSDEMIPNYRDEHERRQALCLWYAYIIEAARRDGYLELVRAEQETLLDDLFEGTGATAQKSDEQFRLLEHFLPLIDQAYQVADLDRAKTDSRTLLSKIEATQRHAPERSSPLSRGDYKICDRVFREEVTAAGLAIRECETLGPIETIGGFGIYTLCAGA